MSEFLRGATIVVLACLVGGLATLAIAYFGGAADVEVFACCGLAALFLLGFVISSDTMMGAYGLFFLLLSIYLLATGHWVLSEWRHLAGAGGGTLFGAFLFTLWLR